MALARHVTGSGPPLLLIHGITESMAAWDPLLPRLSDRHTVLTVDLPGHGASAPADRYDIVSMADAVAATVVEVALGTPLIVGHSLGGMVATAYAARHPARGVVNVDQSLALGDFKEALSGIEPALRGGPESFRSTMTAVIEAMYGPLDEAERGRLSAQRRLDPEVVLAIWAPVLETDPGDLDQLIREVVASITVPYLVVHGSDPGPGYADWLAGLIPGSVVEVWPDHGHYPHLVDPGRFATRVEEFEHTLG